MKPAHLILLLAFAVLVTSCALPADMDAQEFSRQLSAANDALGAYVRATK